MSRLTVHNNVHSNQSWHPQFGTLSVPDKVEDLSVQGKQPPATLSGLVTQVVEDWETHGRDWTRPGFQALAVHRFGNWRMGLQPKLLRAPFSMIYRALYRGVRNFYGIELPYTAEVGRRVVIEHQHGIVIHGRASIGDDCILRHQVTIGNRYMDRPSDAPRLGNGVNVGAGAKILGAISIGDGANIGANAVVLTHVPAGALAVGIPAHVVPLARDRARETEPTQSRETDSRQRGGAAILHRS